MELMAFVDDLKFAYEHWRNHKKIKKVAVVSDKEWVTKIAEMLQSLVPYEVECFESEDIEEARSWLA
jgi:L-2-hydroxyglutarate oxidase LhgO